MTTPLFVSADWLQEHYDDERLQVLDARMLPPGMEAVRDIQAEYLAGHLPDAPYFDIEALSDHTSPYPHMLPRAERFAVAMRELGVSSDKHLVVYDEGNLFSAPRAWWMLKTFGVAQVSILAGGLQGWKAAGFALETGEVSLPEGEFEAQADESRVKRLTDVLLISHEGGAQIVDARAANRFNAEVDEPRPGLHRGHIPNSLNVPWNSLVEQGELKPEAALRQLFADAGVDISKPVVASCGSGVTAVVVILALTALGARDVTLYDGSWGEWGSRDDLPIAK
ncbi:MULTISPECIES: 3-mercaptopyruvate sulfurtransferase [Pantoea]|jgi:thiosulfate/3-mercaptopyruvate sulfurtransferase|uniref:3-mercaptopyruvate sulfurtransferase n=1 Tax=Pantoea TaxID=53335 RepID=UPI0002585329|nr:MULTISPECIES: 3-mercaptopyruvate sulfurtransferase [Pantoea]TPE12076.1 3-mercaptopyruvate sulfurtransferase [Pantoea vagans]EIB97940.1 3-mercaptopyruvate sulfurtransferase [Pantoea sp. Sc1]KAA5975179.1 3-mercaptopyruvate sulfurtransferase [Pantoea sp. M_6]KAA5979536.1 3-mercaptopyruvate sulfurtransferase [Pantoea sp. M_8]KAA5990570.1 3-mercaptopyruvate sulfurtransferase [Pantoea sp. M_5]